MARSSKTKSTSTTTTEGEVTKMASERGSLTALQMVEVGDDVIETTRGGRGHGEYDNFVQEFIDANIRGAQVVFNGVKPGSIKTGLKNAIERAVKAGKVAEGELQVRSKEDNVYLVRLTA